MQKTKIEWCDYSWNPIKGICPVGCWYCYGRRMYQRFKRDPKLSWDGETPLLSGLKPSRIFVCSTMELFHPKILKEWRDSIFEIIEASHNQKHTFIILTKMPERIDRPMPENVWLGVSITGDQEYIRKAYLMESKAKVRFISYEPMLGEVNPSILYGLEWAILGRLTGHGKKYDPDRKIIEGLVENSRGLKVPIFLKNNLREIWGEPLIQEFPAVSLRPTERD